ncbi:MAG: hypothetical protein ACXVB0_16770 [Mucilaginibacter sp.]
MMKKYLFTILLFFACAGSYAQSLSFEDLLNLTNMQDTKVHDFLTASRGFKPSGSQVMSGKYMVQYKSNRGTPDKTETIVLGASTKGSGGNLIRQVTYSTLLESDINALLAQAKKSTLSLIFQGSDTNKNIYRFDNSLFRATISIAFDKKSGSVELQQKE